MKYIVFLILCAFPICINAQEAIEFRNDSELLEKLTKEVSRQFDNDNFTGIFDLRRQMDNRTAAKVNFEQGKPSKKTQFNFEKQKEGVLVIAKLYLCEKCPNYHITTASGFVINDEGVCVTNHHVFVKNERDPSMYLSVYAIDHKGGVYPIKRVIAGDEKSDLALFEIETTNKLHALKMGNNVNVSEPVHLISHPDKMLYTYSDGTVSRNYIHAKHQTYRQSISADFARGSSGAPVFDKHGMVAGVVSSTRSVHYTGDKNLQMVVKEIIPVSLLLEMCKKDVEKANDKKGVPGMRALKKYQNLEKPLKG